MRFALLVFSAAALATLAGCSDPVPQSADGAFWLATLQDDPLECKIGGQTAQVGAIDSTERKTVITDGTNNASIRCEVEGTTAPFKVHGAIDDLANSATYFEISIPSITSDASIDAPAVGSISFSSSWTAGEPYSGPCNFYFEGTKESVASGRIWVSFQCDALTSNMSTCPLKQGYAIFENCLTAPIEE